MKYNLLIYVCVLIFVSSCCVLPPRASLSYNLSTPIEVILPADEPKVEVPIEIQNTSSSKICISKNAASNKKKSRLKPGWSIAPGPGTPVIDASKTSLVLTGLYGQRLKMGRRFRNPLTFRLIIVPKNNPVSSENGSFFLDFSLAPEMAKPNYRPATVRIPIRISYRSAGLPVLISQEVPFNSQ